MAHDAEGVGSRDFSGMAVGSGTLEMSGSIERLVRLVSNAPGADVSLSASPDLFEESLAGSSARESDGLSQNDHEAAGANHPVDDGLAADWRDLQYGQGQRDSSATGFHHSGIDLKREDLPVIPKQRLRAKSTPSASADDLEAVLRARSADASPKEQQHAVHCTTPAKLSRTWHGKDHAWDCIAGISTPSSSNEDEAPPIGHVLHRCHSDPLSLPVAIRETFYEKASRTFHSSVPLTAEVTDHSESRPRPRLSHLDKGNIFRQLSPELAAKISEIMGYGYKPGLAFRTSDTCHEVRRPGSASSASGVRPSWHRMAQHRPTSAAMHRTMPPHTKAKLQQGQTQRVFITGFCKPMAARDVKPRKPRKPRKLQEVEEQVHEQELQTPRISTRPISAGSYGSIFSRRSPSPGWHSIGQRNQHKWQSPDAELMSSLLTGGSLSMSMSLDGGGARSFASPTTRAVPLALDLDSDKGGGTQFNSPASTPGRLSNPRQYNLASPGQHALPISSHPNAFNSYGQDSPDAPSLSNYVGTQQRLYTDKMMEEGDQLATNQMMNTAHQHKTSGWQRPPQKEGRTPASTWESPESPPTDSYGIDHRVRDDSASSSSEVSRSSSHSKIRGRSHSRPASGGSSRSGSMPGGSTPRFRSRSPPEASSAAASPKGTGTTAGNANVPCTRRPASVRRIGSSSPPRRQGSPTRCDGTMVDPPHKSLRRLLQRDFGSNDTYWQRTPFSTIHVRTKKDFSNRPKKRPVHRPSPPTVEELERVRKSLCLMPLPEEDPVHSSNAAQQVSRGQWLMPMTGRPLEVFQGKFKIEKPTMPFSPVGPGRAIRAVIHINDRPQPLARSSENLLQETAEEPHSPLSSFCSTHRGSDAGEHSTDLAACNPWTDNWRLYPSGAHSVVLGSEASKSSQDLQDLVVQKLAMFTNAQTPERDADTMERGASPPSVRTDPKHEITSIKRPRCGTLDSCYSSSATDELAMSEDTRVLVENLNAASLPQPLSSPSYVGNTVFCSDTAAAPPFEPVECLDDDRQAVQGDTLEADVDAPADPGLHLMESPVEGTGISEAAMIADSLKLVRPLSATSHRSGSRNSLASNASSSGHSAAGSGHDSGSDHGQGDAGAYDAAAETIGQSNGGLYVLDADRTVARDPQESICIMGGAMRIGRGSRSAKARPQKRRSSLKSDGQRGSLKSTSAATKGQFKSLPNWPNMGGASFGSTDRPATAHRLMPATTRVTNLRDLVSTSEVPRAQEPAALAGFHWASTPRKKGRHPTLNTKSTASTPGALSEVGTPRNTTPLKPLDQIKAMVTVRPPKTPMQSPAAQGSRASGRSNQKKTIRHSF